MVRAIRCEIKTIVCRQTVSNAVEAQAIFTRMHLNAGVSHCRALIVIESTDAIESNQWQTWITDHYGDDVSIVNNKQTCDRSDELTRHLGNEHDFVIYARDFDAGLFAAVSGTVRRGGTFFWITSPLDQWAASSRYASRLQRLLSAIPNTVSDNEKAAENLSEQNQILLELVELYSRDVPTLSVIEGKRGRGKSTLLGRLAKTLAAKQVDCLFTSTYRGGIKSIEKYIDEPSFTTIDQVLDQTNIDKAPVLLVDEAANISLELLKQWTRHYPKVVLATTVEGYESAGRSFTIRFAQWLDTNLPGWHRFEPQLPWRWNPDDPLEQFIDQLTLSATSADQTVELDSATPVYSEVTQDQLASDENLLKSVYELFRKHHYQTSAIDLQHLLDAPKTKIFIGSVSEHLVAAAIVALEGELEKSLHEAIVSRQRRLTHQLLPQLLAQTANQTTALAARYARVTRIAVSPGWRRRKIASELLRFITTTVSNNVDIIGASFGNSFEARAFWHKNGYLDIHQGYRPNPRSGNPSLAVVKALDTRFSSFIRKVHLHYLDNHQPGEIEAFDELEDPFLTDSRLLERLARGERQVHETLGPLRRLIGASDKNGNWLDKLYENLGCEVHDSQRSREKKLRHWLSRKTT